MHLDARSPRSPTISNSNHDPPPLALRGGYNVHMREEASPHVDALEFEKGREAEAPLRRSCGRLTRFWVAEVVS